MTPNKPVHYSHHAVTEMRDEQITRQMVAWLLAEGTRRYAGARGDSRYYDCTGIYDGRELEISVTENDKRVLIVTAYVVKSKGDQARDQRRKKGDQ